MLSALIGLLTDRLSTRLAIGFGLVALAGILATAAAFNTVNRVGKNLRNLGDVTWEAADGVMNTQIAMEEQVIAAHSLLSGGDSAMQKKRISVLSQHSERELARAIESQLFDSKVTGEVQTAQKEFSSALDQLVEAHFRRSQAADEYLLASRDADRINEIVEGLGDSNVEGLESNPDQNITWNTGLSKYWNAADGAMESRIGYLQQIYGTQLSLTATDDKTAAAMIADADKFQDDAIEMLIASELFNVAVENNDLNGRYVGQNLLDVYKVITKHFRDARDRYIREGRVAQDALVQFSACTDKMLETMSKLESLADNAVDQTVADAEAQMAWGKKFSIGVGIGGLLLGLLSSFLSVRSVLFSINSISDQLKEIASGQGDLTVRLPSKRRDELGDLSRWFNAFVEQLQTMIQKVVVSAKDISSVAQDIAAASEQVTSGATRTKDHSSSVAAASEEMSTSIRAVSESTDSIASNMREVVGRLSNMTQTIRNIVGNADTSSRTVAEARKIVVESSERVSELQDSAADIDRILEVIQDIAEQTNLLALNATIEAARAGEAGKGFAVVATEVKALAKQTSIASDDIRSKIQGIQTTTSSAVNSISQIRDVVDNVSNIVNAISHEVEAQSDSTDEINRFVSNTSETVDFAAQAVRETTTTSSEITRSVSMVDEIARTTADGARRYQDVGGKLSRMSRDLQQLVGQFKA